MLKRFLLVFLVVSFSYCANKKNFERPIVLVITSYNNCAWHKRNLDSLFEQQYSNWRAIYIDDASPDRTGDLVADYLKEVDQSNKVFLIKNEYRRFKMENFNRAVRRYCKDEEIVVDFDGDDWLARPDALSIINNAYSDENVWLTYGSYVTWPEEERAHCEKIPLSVIKSNDYREYHWVTSHPKTFYAWLFKRINPNDLKHNGCFVSMAGDLACMFPMLEMAGGRFKFIQKVLYIHNRANPINVNKRNKNKQLSLATAIREKKRYKKILHNLNSGKSNLSSPKRNSSCDSFAKKLERCFRVLLFSKNKRKP